MSDAVGQIRPEDLRAAVASGLITEAQAAGLSALSANRNGFRSAMPAEDEPFEFFKGFSEIFVSVGLLILFFGFGALVTFLGGPTILIVLPALFAVLAWVLAGYFTLKRRMNLPSMVLASAFGLGVFTSAGAFLINGEIPRPSMGTAAALVAVAGMGAWYWRFRLPFSMFILGLFALVAIYSLADPFAIARGFGAAGSGGFFDLRNSPDLSLATLVFGIGAFILGMWFDTRDPHRLGRYSATAFWLHLLAAPALVNTVALTLYNMGGSTGMLATAAALTGIAALALIIDRRSFLTAGIIYIALLISWAVRGEAGGDVGDWALILILLGGFITALGTWWVPLRAALMRALPEFPGKRSLPPYTEKA